MMARALGGGGSGLAQNVCALEQFDELSRPFLGGGLLAALLVGDGLGECLGSKRTIDHLRSFPTIAPALCQRQVMSNKLDIKTVSSENVVCCFDAFASSARRGLAARHNLAGPTGYEGLFMPCDTAPTRGRSDAAGGAVRGRSLDLSPRPAGTLRPARAAVGGCAFQPSPLTPARCKPKSLVSQFVGAFGPGGAVPNGTTLELWRNHHHIDIAAFFVRFHGFQPVASRDVRVGLRTRPRAYTRGESAGTLEPLTNIYVLEWVKCSKLVPARFQFGTGGNAWFGAAALVRPGNKQRGGYWPGHELKACSTVMRGRGGETFGIELVGAVDRGGVAGSTRAWRNGGFLPFLGGAWGHVGKAMLEGIAQRRKNQPFLVARHKPIRLAWRALVEGPGGSRSASAPPHAPRAAAPLPSMRAHDGAGIWTDLDPGAMHGRGGRAQRERRTNGSGWWLADREPRTAQAGRGAGDGVRGSRVNGVHGRTGGARVN